MTEALEPIIPDRIEALVADVLQTACRRNLQLTPVSEPAARAMAHGALARSAADVAISVTGWAEHGPAEGDEAGLVWFGRARRGRAVQTRLVRFGDVGRAQVRLGCLEAPS